VHKAPIGRPFELAHKAPSKNCSDGAVRRGAATRRGAEVVGASGGKAVAAMARTAWGKDHSAHAEQKMPLLSSIHFKIGVAQP
jgi:hypothetical protein